MSFQDIDVDDFISVFICAYTSLSSRMYIILCTLVMGCGGIIWWCIEITHACVIEHLISTHINAYGRTCVSRPCTGEYTWVKGCGGRIQYCLRPRTLTYTGLHGIAPARTDCAFENGDPNMHVLLGRGEGLLSLHVIRHLYPRHTHPSLPPPCRLSVEV